jgi:sugar O-acyltransferase (sialic acid O-acetyltransferase NeuD family)
MQDVILIGGGGHCRACIDVIESYSAWRIAGILDAADRVGQDVLGHRIVGTDDDVAAFAKQQIAFLITVGQIGASAARERLWQTIHAAGGRMATVVSPQAYVSRTAVLGAGTIVMHRALVNSCAKVGDNVIVNTMALIEHDAVVGDHCHISTAAIVNGATKIGDRCFIGSNAVVHHSLSVPDNSIVRAGSTYSEQP